MKLKAAVIGCGRMGAFTSESVKRFAPECWLPLSHAEAIVLHPDLQLQAFCDSSTQSLQRAATHYGIDRLYQGHHQLFDEVKPDLVGIATRTPGRSEVIEYGIESGTRAFHVEKPLCSSLPELVALENSFARSDVFVTYGTIRRFFDIYGVARDLALSGAYGDLLEIRVNLGRGMLYWTHPHSVDLILFVAGQRKIESVQASLGNVVTGRRRTEITSDPYVEAASVWFEGGLAGHITRAPGADLVLSCSDGEIVVENDGRSITLSVRQGDDPYPVRSAYEGPLPAERPQGTFAPMSHLVKCLQGDEGEAARNRQRKTHIVEGQKILFAIVQSHLQEGRRVRLDEADPEMTIHAKTGENYA